MKIVKIKGGVGNQLFQYAFAKVIEKQYGEQVKLDVSSCSGCKDKTCENRMNEFSISLDYANKREIKNCCLFPNKKPFLSFRHRLTVYLEKTFNRKYFFEKTRSYIDPKTILKYSYYDGYWQNWKYAFEVNNELLEDLKVSHPLSDKTLNTISKFEKENSVFIGVRKGDYTSTKSSRDRYGTFSNEYYLNAMKIINEKIDNPVFHIFTNDINWCKKNMNWGPYNVVYREKEDQTSDFEELIIMANCKHAIIINSTFHWWGAFMIKNKDKIVVAPNEWFADGTGVDIIPPDWIKLERNGELTK